MEDLNACPGPRAKQSLKRYTPHCLKWAYLFELLLESSWFGRRATPSKAVQHTERSVETWAESRPVGPTCCNLGHTTKHTEPPWPDLTTVQRQKATTVGGTSWKKQ